MRDERGDIDRFACEQGEVVAEAAPGDVHVPALVESERDAADVVRRARAVDHRPAADDEPLTHARSLFGTSAREPCRGKARANRVGRDGAMEHDTSCDRERSDGAPSPVARVPPAATAAAQRALNGRRPCRPADALALQRAVGNRAAARLLQRYAKREYWFSNSTWRQADDMTVATCDQHPNHELYAKAGKAAQANALLNAANSGIELVETSTEDTFKSDTGSVTLKKIEARNKVNGTSGDTMTLYADCGRSASVVSGADVPDLKRQAIWSDEGVRTVSGGSPTVMRIAIMKAWLEKEGIRKSLPAASAEEGAKNEADMQEIFNTMEAGARHEAEMESLATRKAAASTDEERDALNAAYKKKADDAANAYWSYYNRRPEAERDAIDQALGINRYAEPAVGQGFTMASGGSNVPNKNRWNFHWGGVVMTSDDNRDRVVLENYSTSDWDEENDRWTFEMYGTKTADQTFHAAHKETGQHGEKPTTMTFEKQ
jgi:hypothetical protein